MGEYKKKRKIWLFPWQIFTEQHYVTDPFSATEDAESPELNGQVPSLHAASFLEGREDKK